MGRFFTTLTHVVALLAATLLIASGSIAILQPTQTVHAQANKKLSSTKSEYECRSKGGYIHPSYNKNQWKGEYCITEAEHVALEQKAEFDENSDMVCKALGIEDCDGTLLKAYDECAAELGKKKEKDKDKKSTERGEVIDCVAKKIDIDKEEFENSLEGKKTINTEEKSTCVVSGMGWIMCPIMLFLGSVADGLQASFENFLKYETLTHSDSSNAIRNMWGTFRNVANLGFIIAFLFIVFSQVSGYGVSNYGIKRALPRLIVLSIIVNISFPIAVITVDLSNIAGANAKHFIENLIVKDGAQPNGYRDVASLLLAGRVTADIAGIAAIGIGGLVIKGMFYGLLGILLPVLISAVVSIGAMLVILVARHALITILVAVMPLALMLQLLPNTKSLYIKWKSLSITLLLLYPIISVVFGLAKFTSSVIYVANPDDTLIKILALGIQATPLLVVPYIIKVAGTTSGIGRLVSRGVQSINKRMSGSATQFVQRKRKLADIQMQGEINKNFSIKEGDSRLRRFGKRSMAAIIGGSAYRTRQAAMKDSFANLRLSRASQASHLRNATQNPKAFGLEPDSHLHSAIVGQAVQFEVNNKKEDIEAQVIFIQDYSDEKLEALTLEKGLSVAQKVALLQEITSRNEARAIAYMQILLNQNATSTYSSTIANTVADTLRQHTPGLVSEQTLQRITTQPKQIVTEEAVETGSQSSEAGASSDTQASGDVRTASTPKTNTIADRVAEREEELKEKDEHKEGIKDITQTADSNKEEVEEEGVVAEGAVDLAGEIDGNLAAGKVSVDDIQKLSPEIIDYLKTNGSEEAVLHLRDALKVAVVDSDRRGKVKNVDKTMEFALQGDILSDGQYETYLTNRRLEKDRQVRTKKKQK